ncbi:MAG: branched-chain amino acid ABC transporter ATP-binding protein/permease [Actinobacteria bacterium]|nr:branched-chain amino acid ABC transporter ATP-binding protein/permease [Actinomycetota bacterium]
MIPGPSDTAFWTFVGIAVLLAWGMWIVALSGQLSVGQAGFMAVGAYGSSWANVAWGWPVPASLVMGCALAAAVAIPVGLAGRRVRGLALVVASLAVGEVIRVSISTIGAVGGAQGLSGMAPVSPGWVAAACVLVLAAIGLGARAGLGPVLRAVASDEDAAAVLGVPAAAVRVGAVVAGAAVTGLAGALAAHYVGFIRPDHYGVGRSFEIALYVLVGGTGGAGAPVLGAVLLTWLEEAARPLGELRAAMMGVLLLAVVILSPGGILTRRRAMALAGRVRVPARRRALARRRVPAGPGPRPTSPGPLRTGLALQATGMARTYGGMAALAGVDLAVRPGEILGVVGPNGAGKTTLLDAVSGLGGSAAGRVLLRGGDVSGRSTHRRASAGLGRAFQGVRLFDELTVAEHLAVAGVGGPGDPGDPLAEAGLADLAGRFPDELGFPLLRRVQVALCLARRPAVALLDEPSPGLDPEELDRLAGTIRAAAAAGVAVVLVDHDLDLVRGLADRIVVLDAGRPLAEGEPGRVLGLPAVREAYLGTMGVVG